MGRSSKTDAAYQKISKEIPVAKTMGWDDNWYWVDVGPKIFLDEKDREQFIHALIAVATQNGLVDLHNDDFRIMYSRRYENEDRYVARLVSVGDGAIKAKIEGKGSGADQIEAFKAFKKDVEVTLEGILQDVPGVNGNVGLPADAPPAYGDDEPGVIGNKMLK